MQAEPYTLLHLGNGRSHFPFNGDFCDRLCERVTVTALPDARAMPEAERAALIREHDILLLIWGSMPVPADIAVNPGKLKYILCMSGELREWVPLSVIDAGIPVSNWGDAPADSLAEGTMALLLAVVKDLRLHIESKAAGCWGMPEAARIGSLNGCDIGLYGMGAVGRRFAELIGPFRPRLTVYDPYVARLPAYCDRAETLRDLFAGSKIVVILAGQSPETRNSVNAELLALLPDGGVLINTARGGIVDQEALFAELAGGRLRAGLDVLDGPHGDSLPPDHPARQWPNLLLTGHMVSDIQWGTDETLITVMRRFCLENLDSFLSGGPILRRMTRERYLRST